MNDTRERAIRPVRLNQLSIDWMNDTHERTIRPVRLNQLKLNQFNQFV